MQKSLCRTKWRGRDFPKKIKKGILRILFKVGDHAIHPRVGFLQFLCIGLSAEQTAFDVENFVDHLSSGFFQNVLDGICGGVITVDNQGNILRANFCQLTAEPTNGVRNTARTLCRDCKKNDTLLVARISGGNNVHSVESKAVFGFDVEENSSFFIFSSLCIALLK